MLDPVIDLERLLYAPTGRALIGVREEYLRP
jgi:hypothetical protein